MAMVQLLQPVNAIAWPRPENRRINSLKNVEKADFRARISSVMFKKCVHHCSRTPLIGHSSEVASNCEMGFQFWCRICVGFAASVLVDCSLEHGEPAFAEVLSVRFPWETSQLQEEPPRGTCATCIGVVDETLGTCGATTNCVSSFDDRPNFFVAPWEFPGRIESAVDNVRTELLSCGATIDEQGDRYIHAVFNARDGSIDDVELLFSDPSEDATVNLRSASRATFLNDNGRNKNRLEDIRKSLGWEQVPILRNRKRALFFIESPWDSFGPEPPPTVDYSNGAEFLDE